MKISSSKIIIGIGVLALVAAAGLAMISRQKSETPAPVVSPKRIGVVEYIKESDPSFEGLKKGMADLGYVEGKDVVYEYQVANADQKKVAEIAKSFVAQNVDLIYAITFPSTQAVFNAMRDAGRSDIPVVFAQANNPVEGGIIQSYKSSGNNFTGVTADFASLTPKKLEILQRINPNIKKIGFFRVKEQDDKYPSNVLTVASLKENAPKFGITLIEYSLENQENSLIPAAFQAAADRLTSSDIDALLHPTGVLYSGENLTIAAELGNRLRIPVLFALPGNLNIGGLFVYSHDFYAIGEQTAPMVDKIFRGVSPSDIPVEPPRKNTLYLSLENAAQIGVTIPRDVLEIAQPWGT